jgi:hypothetical protein
VRFVRRRLLRFFDHGPASIGCRFVDALDDRSSAVNELGSADDAGRNHPHVEHTVLQRAHLQSTGARCDAARPPLLQNR